MTVENALTLQLAVALGAFILAAALGVLAAPERWSITVNEFKTSSALSYIGGFGAFAFGVALLLAHNAWDNFLAVVINLIAWAGIIKGLVLLGYPKPLYAFADTVLEAPPFRVFIAIVMVIGGLLLGLGLTGTVV